MVLQRLLDAGEDLVVRVYCQPDRPKGRGKKLVAPPVRQLGEERRIPVSQPAKLKDGSVAHQLREEAIDLAIVVAYGRILPPSVFEAPAFHTWNVHASLLPKYRGASPIQHAVLNGEKTTGVTLMQLSEGLDEGPMLLKRELPIGPDETAAELTERMAELGADALLQGLRQAKDQGLEVVPQDDAEATFAPLIDKAHGELDLQRPAHALACQVRAFDPWPGTFVRISEGSLKILRARVAPGDPASSPGSVLSLAPFRVQTGEDSLEIEQVQAPGRKPVDAADFLRGAGRNIAIGSQLSKC